MRALFLVAVVGSIGASGSRVKINEILDVVPPEPGVEGAKEEAAPGVEDAKDKAATSLVETADVPLFKDMVTTRFKKVRQALVKDSGSVFKRLMNAFGTAGQNIVVVGAGGAGKTETILRAMEDNNLAKVSFDLRAWYLTKNTIGIDKKSYIKGYKADGSSDCKTDENALVKAAAAEIKADIKSKAESGADVLFFDEVDLGNGFLNTQELDTMSTLLTWGKEVAPTMTKVVVLHPMVSTQPEIISMLKRLGFPKPGDASWIDFSSPYSTAVETAIVTAILQDCEGSSKSKKVAINHIMGYIKGLPSAYMPFLIDKDGALMQLNGQSYAQATTAIKEAAVAKVGGRLIKINVGIQASPPARQVIKDLIANPTAQPGAGTATDGAVACMAVISPTPGVYYVPQVMQDAFAEYCAGDAKAKSAIAPICDAF